MGDYIKQKKNKSQKGWHREMNREQSSDKVDQHNSLLGAKTKARPHQAPSNIQSNQFERSSPKIKLSS